MLLQGTAHSTAPAVCGADDCLCMLFWQHRSGFGVAVRILVLLLAGNVLP